MSGLQPTCAPSPIPICGLRYKCASIVNKVCLKRQITKWNLTKLIEIESLKRKSTLNVRKAIYKHQNAIKGAALLVTAIPETHISIETIFLTSFSQTVQRTTMVDELTEAILFIKNNTQI